MNTIRTCVKCVTVGVITVGGIIYDGITSRARLVRVTSVEVPTQAFLSAVCGMTRAGGSEGLVHDEWKGSSPPRGAAFPASRERGGSTAAKSNVARTGRMLPDDIGMDESGVGVGEG